MKNIFLLFILTLSLLLIPESAFASTEAGQSAQLKPDTTTNTASIDVSDQIREHAIKNVLNTYNSPLAGEADTFVSVSRALELDPYLLVSISGVESTFGKKYIKSTHNVFGYGAGKIEFDDFSHGISRVGYALKYKYIDAGAESLADIGYIYAGKSTTWAPKVASFMKKFEDEEQRLRLYNLL